MKSKILCLALLLPTFFFSCSSDLDYPENDEKEVEVTFTAELPEGIATRSFSDGTTATNLHYAVYEDGNDTNPLITDDKTLSLKSATVSLHLLTGKKYNVIFWASAEGSPYTYNDATQSVTVDYENLTANSESCDAFYASETVEVSSAYSKDVKLRRPFAQVNIGVDDLSYSKTLGLTPENSELTTTVYTTINLKTGAVSDEKEVTFKSAAIPGDDESFPVTTMAATYKYISMNYLLVPVEKEILNNVRLTVSDEDMSIERNFTNIPVQRNYRTNIYGSILTNPVGYKVSVDSDYDGSLRKVSVWDGKTKEAPTSYMDGILTITKASELAYFADAINSGSEEFADLQIINLDTDIDFAGYPWTPIGTDTDVDFKMCLFNGNGFTIHNLKVEGEYEYAGLFGYMGIGFIADLTIDNAEIINSNSGESYTGSFGGRIGNGVSCMNCNVIGDVKISGSGYVGGFVGQAGGSGLTNICVAANSGSYVKSTDTVACGGICGYFDVVTFLNAESNIDVIAYSSSDKIAHVGGVVGLCSKIDSEHYNNIVYAKSTGNVTLYNRYISSTSASEYAMTIGGLIGSMTSESTISFVGSSFTGDIAVYNTTSDNDITSVVKENNKYWSYLGWLDISGSLRIISDKKITY